jgi:hypothetical protein
VQNFEKEKSFIVGPSFNSVSKFGISSFRKTGGRGLCFEIPKITKCDIAWRKGGKYFDESVFQFSVVEESRNSEGVVAKS